MSIRGRWHLAEVLLPGGTEPLLDAGVQLSDSAPLTVSVSRTGRVLEFSLTSFNVPIATARLAKAVSDVAGTDVQCLPVNIAGQSGMIVLNAVRVVRCLDEARSDFVKWTKRDHRADLVGQYRQIKKLVLDVGAIPPEVHFFRIAGSLVELVISDVVKEAMERAGCLGAKFVELQM